jgi:DNA invertase Pin-like site-specific DNA recombinase
MVGMADRAAAWCRVSTDEQDAANQHAATAQFCQHHGYEVVRTFTVDDSAWKDGTGGKEYQAAVAEVMDAAHRGEFNVLVVWALDRLTREGAEGALRLIRRLRERGVTLVSVQESWLNGAPEVQDILVSFAGWMAQQESQRKSERVRAGLERRKAQGLPVGRAAGSRT